MVNLNPESFKLRVMGILSIVPYKSQIVLFYDNNTMFQLHESNICKRRGFSLTCQTLSLIVNYTKIVRSPGFYNNTW